MVTVKIIKMSKEHLQQWNTYIMQVLDDIRRRQSHPTPVLCLESPMDGGAW